MKTKSIFSSLVMFVFFVILTGNTNGQAIKVNSNGYVGIGITPTCNFDFYGSKAQFGYSGIDGTVRLRLTNTHPRFEHRASNDKFVFCNGGYDGNWDWSDIECKSVIEKSDSSLKVNFQSLQNNSLSKIMRLKGYSYNWKSNPDGKRRTGLLGQQVERVMPEAVYTVDSTGEKLLAYSNFIPYLVEAIKEQQNQLDKKERQNTRDSLKINNLEERVANLEKEIQRIKAECCNHLKGKKSGNLSSTVEPDESGQPAGLFQNHPNPFTESTEIEYYLPETTKQASLYIYDMSGNQIKNIKLTQTGNGSITINGGELNPGMYMYTLIADGKEMDTRKMILTE